jgi:hypothetical protein
VFTLATDILAVDDATAIVRAEVRYGVPLRQEYRDLRVIRLCDDEIVFGVDPDHHNGSFEWLIVAVLLAATFVFSLLARRAWKMAVVAV